MPPIYLVQFRQGPLGNASAHWGIFLPDPTSPVDYFGTPHFGSLFHANKEGTCFDLFRQHMTHFEHEKPFRLAGHPSLLSCIRLDGTEEPDDTLLSVACNTVTLHRQFNFITENCQNWVMEVVGYLVDNMRIPGTVFEQMRLAGYVPLGETRCVRCVKSSLSLHCSCRSNRRLH